MIPWEDLHQTTLPSGETLSLHRRNDEFVIRAGGVELMNSRIHGSEDALGELATQPIAHRTAPKVLIGGLGMGFTLASALQHLPETAHVVCAELVPAVIEWNRGPLAHLNASALDDPRVTIVEGDVQSLIIGKEKHWDAILLDVDNGPEGLTRIANDELYTTSLLQSARTSLTRKGILAIWSVSRDPAFERRLKGANFDVQALPVYAHGNKGRRYLIWLATRKF